MTCTELLQGIDYTGTPPAGEAGAVTDDSRRFQAGDIFVCVAGRHYDGHDFAQQAVALGACMVVTQRPLGLSREVTVPDTRAAYALLCANSFGRPAQKLVLVGVTGTNGKTTVTSALKKLLQNLGHRCGLIGTNACEIGDMEIPAKFTTPGPWELHALLARMVAAGCTHAVMEASSQGLAQKRLFGLHFALAMFTNLTQDHLDEHGTMEEYYAAKKLLFMQADAALINTDDAWGRRLFMECGAPVKKSYAIATEEAGAVSVAGTEGQAAADWKADKAGAPEDTAAADFTADNIALRIDGVAFTWRGAWRGKGFVQPATFPIPGLHSVANALAAAGGAVLLGEAPAAAARALGAIGGVRGRSEVLYSGKFTVLCDFAHTADALSHLLASLRPFAQKRMVVLFGCAGDRDAEKRPAMGEAAARYADAIYLTADNPRTEDPEKTMADALPPIALSGKPCRLMADREAALADALDSLDAGDVLVLCGKGHEDYQVMDGYTLYLSERQLVAAWLGRHGLAPQVSWAN